MKLESSRQIFETSSHIKFNENPSIGSRGFPCRRTDMSKLIDAFRNFAKQLKKSENPSSVYIFVFLPARVVSGCRRKVAENFWFMTQRVVVISYRRFVTTYWFKFQGSRAQKTACNPNTEFLQGSVWADTTLLRLFTAHTLHYINSILGLQAFFWILEP